MPLYDRQKSVRLERLDGVVQPDDIELFCKEHDVEFHAMGTPPGVGGTGWDDPAVFRVATRPGMSGCSPRGITIPIAKVEKWLAERAAERADALRFEVEVNVGRKGSAAVWRPMVNCEGETVATWTDLDALRAEAVDQEWGMHRVIRVNPDDTRTVLGDQALTDTYDVEMVAPSP